MESGDPCKWIASVPPAPSDFTTDATLSLTADESVFLRERIAQTSPHSLSRFLADLDEDVPDILRPGTTLGSRRFPPRFSHRSNTLDAFPRSCMGPSCKVFGQPRQDDLLDLLLGQMDLEEARKHLRDLRIPIEPA